jgi:hypothetical protein
MSSAVDPAIALAVKVISRLVVGEGVELRQMDLTNLDATVHRCHDNVREWIKLHPEHKHVYGFLVADQGATSVVIAHSAVEDTDGTLCDITPSESDYRYTFVRHVGTEAEFDLIDGKERSMLEIPNRLLQKLGVTRYE